MTIFFINVQFKVSVFGPGKCSWQSNLLQVGQSGARTLVGIRDFFPSPNLFVLALGPVMGPGLTQVC